MRRLFWPLLAAFFVLAFAASAPAAPNHHRCIGNDCTGGGNTRSQIVVNLWEVNGYRSGAGATIYCQTPNGTGSTISDYEGIGDCFVPTGTQTAVYAEFTPNCFTYYWGRGDMPGYGLWVTPWGTGISVNIYMNYYWRWC
jgi:hypothetical protein